MRSRRVASLLLPGAIGLLSSGAWAADVGSAVAAPSTADDSAPAASPAPPTADAPRPISAPAPPSSEPPKKRTANNAIYVEGLGAGLIYSVNYEHMFGDFAPRVGFEYLSVSATTSTGEAHTSLIGIPLSVSYLGIGSLQNMFEVGAGATILLAGEGASFIDVDESSSASGSSTLVFGTVTAGYRFQMADGGFMFRGGLNAVIGGDTPLFPWPYIGLGGAF
jgi:hypothetical protein